MVRRERFGPKLFPVYSVRIEFAEKFLSYLTKNSIMGNDPIVGRRFDELMQHVQPDELSVAVVDLPTPITLRESLAQLAAIHVQPIGFEVLVPLAHLIIPDEHPVDDAKTPRIFALGTHLVQDDKPHYPYFEMDEHCTDIGMVAIGMDDPIPMDKHHPHSIVRFAVRRI